LCAGISPFPRVEMSDLELSPFHDKGGPVRAYQTFGKDLDSLLKELNEVLAA
jgi:type I restriction enzyme R subunit